MEKLNLVKRISKHEFVANLLKDLQSINQEKLAENVTKSMLGQKIVQPIILKPFQSYASTIINPLFYLLETLKRIEIEHSFVLTIPDIRFLEEKYGIKEKYWLEYHFGNYIVDVAKIFDQILILTNYTLEIGFTAKDSKEQNILKNTKVPKSLRKVIKEFKTFTSKIRNVRNIHVHQGALEIQELIEDHDSSMHGILSLLREADPKSELLSSLAESAGLNSEEELFSELARDMKLDLLSHIEDTCDELAERLENVLNEFWAIYRRKRTPITVHVKT